MSEFSGIQKAVLRQEAIISSSHPAVIRQEGQGVKAQQFPAALEDSTADSRLWEFRDKISEERTNMQLSGVFYGMPLQPAPDSPG